MSKLFDLDQQYNRERIIKEVSMVETEFIKLGREYDKLKDKLEQVTEEREAMREALDKIEAVIRHLMLTQGYQEERDWLGAFIHTMQDVARAALKGGKG